MSDKNRNEVFMAPIDPVPADGSMVDPTTTVFRASWQAEGENDEMDGEELRGADAAIEWGRARSAVVWIRLGNRGDTYFSAGEEHAADDDPEEFISHWPPDGSPPGGWWLMPPVPTVAEVESMTANVRSGRAAARRGGAMGRRLRLGAHSG